MTVPLGDATVRPVVLVGMMGAGKTTVGRRVAKLLDRPFVDADDELAERTGRSVRDWFAEHGEAVFRQAEFEVMKDLVGDGNGRVIAAGGGAVTSEATRACLRSGALVVWLRAGVPFLATRVGRKDHRPLLDDDMEATLTRLMDERSDLYAAVADIVIDVEPVHHRFTKPKRELARLVADRVQEAERAAVR